MTWAKITKEARYRSYSKEERGEEMEILSVGYSLKSLPIKLGECKLIVYENRFENMYVLRKRRREDKRLNWDGEIPSSWTF